MKCKIKNIQFIGNVKSNQSIVGWIKYKIIQTSTNENQLLIRLEEDALDLDNVSL